MICIGALAGTGAISIGFTILAAIVGAVLGDGISYWLGRHYKQELKRHWPFSLYPQILLRGEAFFNRHGGKSVLFGRFVGPVRAVIPVIAGMLDMPIARFVVVNVISAVGWAFAYIVPGIVLAGSLTLIGAVSTRLSLMLLLLVTFLWLAFWLCRKAFFLLGKLGPKEERLLLPTLILTLILTGWLFLGVLEDLVSKDPLVEADHAIYQFLQGLRTPWGDQLMVAVTELGDGVVNIAISVAVLLSLLFRRQFRDAMFWIVALGGGACLVQLFKWALHRQRPIEVYQSVASWSFPSGHTLMSVVLYGFLAIILVRRFSPSRGWIPFACAIGASLMIAFSRLYLGVHWLSDVLGGLSLGWAWVTLLGVLYLRTRVTGQPRTVLIVPAFLAMVLTGTWHIDNQHADDIIRYQSKTPVQTISTERWREDAWQKLPGWRIDLAGEIEQPLTFQWAGDPEHLADKLVSGGWTRNVSFNFKKLFNILIPRAKVQQLPLFPLLENGRQEQILMSMSMDEKRLVLRLWPTEFTLSDVDHLLWVGSVDFEYADSIANILTLPRASGLYASALEQLISSLNIKSDILWRQRPLSERQLSSGWDGKTLLLAEKNLLICNTYPLEFNMEQLARRSHQVNDYGLKLPSITVRQVDTLRK